MPWTKTKGGQLDLLESELAREQVEAASPPRPVRQHGHAMLVAISALDEDPNNPRTEVAEDGLDELTEDIRQHGILQPIVVHPADGAGRYRIHFGAQRWRAARRAGLEQVPVVVRDAPPDPYAQVAENQKRRGLTPLDLARFIRSRIDAGASNTDVARRLGMSLTTVAHHLTLLELPPSLGEAFKSGRCTSPRTLHELSKLNAEVPVQVQDLLVSGAEITRTAVSALRAASEDRPASGVAAPSAHKLITQANAACDRLERVLNRIEPADNGTTSAPALAALRTRVEAITTHWLQGSDRQTPSQAER